MRQVVGLWRQRIWICLGTLIFIGAGPSPAEAQFGPVARTGGALVRNNLMVKVVTKKADVPIREEPQVSAPVVDQLGAPLTVLYVFPPNESQAVTENGFYRVGRTPFRKDLLGWISEEDVQQWDHRECAKFGPPKGRSLAKIYGSFEDVKLVASSGNPDIRVAISSEPSSFHENVRYRMLLPILEKKAESLGGEMLTFYHLAYVHGIGLEEGLQGTEEFARTAQKEEIIKEHGKLDVVFVIDATVSMKPFIDATTAVVRQTIEELAKHTEVEARFGLIAYRDRLVQQPQALMEYVTKVYSPLTPDLEAFYTTLSQIDEAKTGSEGTEEALFDGIRAAIEDLLWSEHAVPVIILIGDASGHATGSIRNPENLTPRILVEKAAEKSIRFLCVKIRNPEDPSNWGVHEQQLKTLAEGASGGSTKGKYVGVDGGQIGSFESSLMDVIGKQIDLTEELINYARAAASTGKLPQRPPQISEEQHTILLGLLDPALLEKSPEKVPIFAHGWLEEFDQGRPVVIPHVMMSADEVALLEFVLMGLEIGTRTADEKIRTVILQDIEKATGEKLEEGQTVAEYMEKKHGLPVKSKLLRFTIEEIRQWSDPRKEETANAIQERAKLLSAFKNDSRNWIRVSDQFEYAFVPVSSLP